jgi:DNA repair protein RecO (recombination protein O)
MPLYRDEAVVLRVHKLGEADRIVSLLTRRHGRVRAVGKGVRRTTSRFGARLEPGSHIDVQLHSRLAEGQAPPDGRRGLELVTQTESLGAYGAQLATDYSAWTAVSAICETAERLTEEGEPVLRLYLLLVGALKALVAREHEPGLILDAFLVRAMSTAGWEPALSDCAKCSAPGPHAAFNVPAGGAVCENCRPPGSARPARETIALAAALLGGDWAVADASEPGPRREASGLIAAHLQWHLERGLRSLPFVDRGELMSPGAASVNPTDARAGANRMRPAEPSDSFPAFS